MSSSPSPAAAVLPLIVRTDQSVAVLTVPPELSFEALRDWLREQIPVHGGIAGRTARLDLGPREIKLFDLRRLVHFLREEFAVDVTGLYVRSEVVHAFAERELKLKLFPQAGPPRWESDPPSAGADGLLTAPRAQVAAEDAVTDELHGPGQEAPPEPGETGDEPFAGAISEVLAAVTVPDADEPGDAATPPGAPSRSDARRDPRTLTVRRTLRSGAVVQFDGDMLVFGDVNPGAHLVATGNVVVLGALKGFAHAGAAGDESSFILSLDMRPTQIRIGRKIAIAPDRPPHGDVLQPEMATVIDGQIVLEPYQGRLRAAPAKG